MALSFLGQCGSSASVGSARSDRTDSRPAPASRSASECGFGLASAQSWGGEGGSLPCAPPAYAHHHQPNNYYDSAADDCLSALVNDEATPSASANLSVMTYT